MRHQVDWKHVHVPETVSAPMQPIASKTGPLTTRLMSKKSLPPYPLVVNST